MQVRMDLTLPRDARYVGLLRSVAVGALQELSVPRGAVEDVELALGEACANAVRHAEGTSAYHVSLCVGADGCEIEIVDVGPGFDPREVEPDEFDPAAEAGRGLFLMRTLVDDLRFSRVDDHTHVVLVKRWAPEGNGAARADAARDPQRQG